MLSRAVNCSVVNAGDGAHEHPTQGLLDLFTIRERFGKIAGLKVAIVGDIVNSRVARSNLWGLKKLGAEVILVGPPTSAAPRVRIPGRPMRARFRFRRRRGGCHQHASRAVRAHPEQPVPVVREFTRLFGLHSERFSRCKPDVFVMHPGPMNRGIEIASNIADGPNSGILTQVTNGLAVRMAVLYLVTQAGG